MLLVKGKQRFVGLAFGQHSVVAGLLWDDMKCFLSVVSIGVLRRCAGLTSLAERMVPEELWELFRRPMPAKVVLHPQGGGWRRAGDCECLAVIIFVATSGCFWRRLSPVFGPAWPTVYRRFAQWSKVHVWARLHRVILDELESPASWTGRGARSTPSACEPPEGAPDGTESDRPRQKRIENPPHRRPQRPFPSRLAPPAPTPTAARPATADLLRPTRPQPPRTAPKAIGQAARRRGLRLRPPPSMGPSSRHHAPHRPLRETHVQRTQTGDPPI